jgi:ornithine carbamoyltransferase
MSGLQGRDLLSAADLSASELQAVMQLAAQLKQGKPSPQGTPILGLLFDKPSTRTRVSFGAAMARLGGSTIELNPNATQIGRGEPIADTARVLERYLDVLAIRTFQQADIETFARWSQIPAINALSDREHPCQVWADLFTIGECLGGLEGLTLAYLGDGNNVAQSLLLGGAIAGLNLRIATPAAYAPETAIVEQARALAGPQQQIELTEDPQAAAHDTQVLYTDVWTSMGQQATQDRTAIFQAYRIDAERLRQAADEAIVLHCLPAHRGEEITNDVMEGPQARIWQQAENRMHVQQALLASVLGLA